ncbi:MAG TPA: ParA family protein, partial [Halococcus sp.]|nr:ParA family protein [Halococcus sp.]
MSESYTVDSATSTPSEGEPRAVAFAMNKGGVGKTVLSINVADRLAARGHRVLLIDADPAGNATEGIGLQSAYTDGAHFGQFLSEDEEYDDVGFDDIIVETDRFDVMPAHEDLGRAQSVLDSDRMAVTYLDEKIVTPLLGDVYDYILIDTEASGDSLFMDGAIWAARHVMVPLIPSEESVRGFESLMNNQLASVRAQRDVQVLALVPNMCRSDNELKRLVSNLSQNFPEYTPSFAREEMLDTSPGAGIRERIAIKRAWREGVPLSVYDAENDMI